MSAIDDLAAVCAAADLPFDAAWLPTLRRLAAALVAGQARTNLVGDASEAGLLAHVREALTTAAAAHGVLGRAPLQVADVGAGAGLEALMLAIAWPQSRVVAIEPRKLRAQFLAETAAALALRNVQVIDKTLHSAALPPNVELVTARAVWPFPEWPERARPILTPAGLAAVHTQGPAAALADRLQAPGWRLRAARDVPGQKPYAIGILQRR